MIEQKCVEKSTMCGGAMRIISPVSTFLPALLPLPLRYIIIQKIKYIKLMSSEY